MSTPPVLAASIGNCKEYKPECVSHGQEVLFYTAMALIAVGMGGHLTSFKAFLEEQIMEDEDEIYFNISTFCSAYVAEFSVTIVALVIVLGFPYINPWSIRFGIPTICTLVATILFFTGSCSYTYGRPRGSALTMFFRVFVVAVSKLLHRSPRDPTDLYETNDPGLHMVPHTNSLRCLDKAAIVVTQPREEQENIVWRLCRVTEVEETKAIIRMIPVWMTFILCGVVSALGFTFFIAQLDHLNPKLGKLKIPTVFLFVFFEQAVNQLAKNYDTLANVYAEMRLGNIPPLIGIAISMILAILCCITAAKIEERRLGVVRKHDLVDKPDERVPMTIFWLLSQFVLLGLFQDTFYNCAITFSVVQSSMSTRRYTPLFVKAMFGVGIIGSVLSVYVVGKVSERGGKMNWFQKNLNASRIDKYYWTLAWLMAVNLVVYILVALLYRYNEGKLRRGQENPDQDDSEVECCC
ncbi:hypothetical protein F511_44029 [Dorcoceras hygrometricum]|uniref:Uncharacterized protein n=1 Tax=Dorcoceras hygrometricum TaxID=472368 RepID=A0A2Z7A5L7_9LAMI|nr:hypothetical protein F511_44029 [Dorcoceras hygrometricum]